MPNYLRKTSRSLTPFLLLCGLGALSAAQAQPGATTERFYSVAFVQANNGAESGYTLQVCNERLDPAYRCYYPWNHGDRLSKPILLKAIPKSPAQVGTCSRIASAVAKGAFAAVNAGLRVGQIAIPITACTFMGVALGSNLGTGLFVGGVLFASSALWARFAGENPPAKQASSAAAGADFQKLVTTNWELFSSRKDNKFAAAELPGLIQALSHAAGIQTYSH